MQHCIERTVAIVKPDVKSEAEKIIAFFLQVGFYVVHRADVVIDEASAGKLSIQFAHDSTKYEQHVRSLTGEAVVIVISKVGAVQAWLDAMGPENPSIARREKPHSIRALYGTDEVHNAVYGSESVVRAEADAALFFDVPVAGTKEWVIDQLVPGVTEAMAELAIARPVDPYSWLISWLRDHRPILPRPKAYEEPVLLGNCLKSDRFQGIGQVRNSNISGIDPNGLTTDDGGLGYWNFRKAFGIAPVYGIGQSTVGGIEYCLRFISRQRGYDKIVCLNMREEPVVFVNGLPIAPRENGRLNENIEHLCGIDGYELTLIENRLKQDIIDAHSPIQIFHQGSNMANEAKMHEFSEKGIMTLGDVYQQLQDEGIKCEYVRIPITDETAPDVKAFDAMVAVMKRNLMLHPAFVMNCQMGRGRTTTAMVCVAMFWRIRSRVPLGSVAPLDPQQPNLLNGEFSSVLHLLQLLPSGVSVKSLADAAIDDCGAFHNLRTCIFAAKQEGDKAAAASQQGMATAEGRDAAFFYHRALNYLNRYCYVLLFGAYLMENVRQGLEISFDSYLRSRWMLRSPLSHLSLD